MSGTSFEKNLQNLYNLEKQHALLNRVWNILCGEKEVTNKHKINQKLFYKNLFTEKSESLKEDISTYLSQTIFPF